MKPFPFAAGLLVLTLLLASAAAASEKPDAFPPVRIIDRGEHYAITGSTIDQIHEQLILRADGLEGSGNGSTHTRFKVIKTLLQQPDRCTLTALEIDVTITTTLPRWRPGSVVSDLLRLRWKQSSAILTRHEAGHREHAVEAAQILRKRLVGLGQKDDCLTLDATIALELHANLQRLDLRDARYDYRTWNGLRDDPLEKGAPGAKSQSLSPQRPYRADRTFLDFYSH